MKEKATVIKMVLPDSEREKFGKSYQNKIMEDYEKRAESEANRVAGNAPVVPTNIIPQRIAEAAETVQQEVQIQAAREIKPQ